MKKIFYVVFVSMMCFVATNLFAGDYKNSELYLMPGYGINDTTIEENGTKIDQALPVYEMDLGYRIVDSYVSLSLGLTMAYIDNSSISELELVNLELMYAGYFGLGVQFPLGSLPFDIFAEGRYNLYSLIFSPEMNHYLYSLVGGMIIHITDGFGLRFQYTFDAHQEREIEDDNSYNSAIQKYTTNSSHNLYVSFVFRDQGTI